MSNGEYANCECGHPAGRHHESDLEPNAPCTVQHCDCTYYRKPMAMRYKLQYLFWGIVSNLAIECYYKAPREALQDELLNLHRYALKRAHTTRLKGEDLANPGRSHIDPEAGNDLIDELEPPG